MEKQRGFSPANRHSPPLCRMTGFWRKRQETRAITTESILIRKMTELGLAMAADSLRYWWRKANFNADQPRIPAGEPGGGRWTDGGGFGSSQFPSSSDFLPNSPAPWENGNYDVATTCAEHIAAWCKGSVMREFPSQYLDVDIHDVRRDAQSGNAAARKALKLMFDKRFQK